MPAERNTNQSRRLTAAGLIAVTAATLLMMAWAILPTPAFANGTFPWGGNGFPNVTCVPGQVQTMLWIFNDNGTAVPTTLSINGVQQSGSWVPFGNTFKFTVTANAQNFPPLLAGTSVTFTGNLGNSTVLTLSGCNEGQTTTTTVPTTTTTVPTTTTTVPTTTTTVPTTTTTETTTTTTVPTTTTTVPTTTTTTTTPGGGGGGGNTTVPTTTTTTTASPTVGPTTIHKSTTTTDEVLPTTVTPGGTAFTGVENVVPIGAIALMLMTSGSGLLWAGSRRRRHDGSEDED
jgi:hypothetical protein